MTNSPFLDARVLDGSGTCSDEPTVDSVDEWQCEPASEAPGVMETDQLEQAGAVGTSSGANKQNAQEAAVGTDLVAPGPVSGDVSAVLEAVDEEAPSGTGFLEENVAEGEEEADEERLEFITNNPVRAHIFRHTFWRSNVSRVSSGFQTRTCTHARTHIIHVR